MYLKHLTLHNFRSYSKTQFDFTTDTTLIVGPNTAGKTNIVEAIYFLSSGGSFRTDKDDEAIRFDQDLSRIKGRIGDTDLEIVLTHGMVSGIKTQVKKYLVNGVAKRLVDFSGLLPSVLFAPSDLEIIVGSPSIRRGFLDSILTQTDRDYRKALIEYTKGIRQRNALLEHAQRTGKRNKTQFEYWDELVIKTGNSITAKRETFIHHINSSDKSIFDCALEYDKSIISTERLLQYYEAETASGVTLVGPHRDDIAMLMYNNILNNTHNIKMFGSRGQQRLVVLQLKILQLSYMEEKLGERPLLLLDDIFSELDEGHIQVVLGLVGKQQTIITTTHKEFIPSSLLKKAHVIELKR